MLLCMVMFQDLKTGFQVTAAREKTMIPNKGIIHSSTIILSNDFKRLRAQTSTISMTARPERIIQTTISSYRTGRGPNQSRDGRRCITPDGARLYHRGNTTCMTTIIHRCIPNNRSIILMQDTTLHSTTVTCPNINLGRRIMLNPNTTHDQVGNISRSMTQDQITAILNT